LQNWIKILSNLG